MKIETMPLTELVKRANPRNAKSHDLESLIASFKRFGFSAPPTVDDASGVLVAGHGRIEALKQMRNGGEPPPGGIKEKGTEWLVPVISGIKFKNKQEREAYTIADNQLTISGGWRFDALTDLLAELREQDGGLEGLGFDDDDLDEIFAAGKEVDVSGHTRTIGGPQQHKVRPPIQMTHADWTLHLGDCIEGLCELAESSVDAVVTDPPAGIAFMGRSWDSDKGGRDRWITWLRAVMTECLRVLKPGGHALVWSLPRTSHWTATAIEDAGFEIRDVVFHTFGTGFPKSLDVSKAIDSKLGAVRAVIGQRSDGVGNTEESIHKHEGFAASREQVFVTAPASQEAQQWEGWGTALKPAVEPWILARKPLSGTIAENVLEHGAGGLNIDGCRIGDELMPVTESDGTLVSENFSMSAPNTGRRELAPKHGRWPAHFVLSHSDGCKKIGTATDEHAVNIGERTGDGSRALEFGMGTMETTTTTTTTHDVYECVDGCAVKMLEEQSEGASRFFFVAKPHKSETEAGLGALEERTPGELTARADGSAGLDNPRAGAGRTSARRNQHPTKKGIELMRWLVRLVTPPGGLVADPFAGSGTTGLAALVEGCRFVGWEQNPDYHRIASERLRTIIEDPRSVETADDAE
jgi:hypothetical protein